MSYGGLYKPQMAKLQNHIKNRFSIYESTVAKHGLSGAIHEEDAITGRRPYTIHKWSFPRIWWAPWRRDLTRIEVETYIAGSSNGWNYDYNAMYSSDFNKLSGIYPHKLEVLSRIKEDMLNYEINRLLTEK